MKPFLFLPLLGLLLMINAPAETVKDREGAVRADKADWNRTRSGITTTRSRLQAGRPHWKAAAGGPALRAVSFLCGHRCRRAGGTGVGPLLDQFVCVRVIHANALDLSRFQFDYDLSFSAMMFHGDGTVYGRFGSWQHQRDPLNQTTASFKKALEDVTAKSPKPAHLLG